MRCQPYLTEDASKMLKAGGEMKTQAYLDLWTSTDRKMLSDRCLRKALFQKINTSVGNILREIFKKIQNI